MKSFNKLDLFHEIKLTSSAQQDLYYDTEEVTEDDDWGHEDEADYCPYENILFTNEFGNDYLFDRLYWPELEENHPFLYSIIDEDCGDYGIGVIKQSSILGQLLNNSDKILKYDIPVRNEDVYMFVYPFKFKINGHEYSAEEMCKLTSDEDKKKFMEEYVLDTSFDDFAKTFNIK